MRFIGNKTKLLNNIEEFINKKITSSETFCDIFSGTSSVARHFKKKYRIYSNDLMYFSYCLQMGTIENDSVPSFITLNKELGISNPLDFFNSMNISDMEKLIPYEKRFFQNNYSPQGGRMYITDDNALRIDFCRITIEDWKKQHVINDNEYYYLIACLIEGIPFVSNTAGTYGAYNKFWDPRSNKKFELYNLDVVTNKRNNKCFNQDGVQLLKQIEGDILYIDPPYNERQYLPNYHLLETAAKYDYPVLKGVTGQRPSNTSEKSAFCNVKTAYSAFEEMISNAKFKHIILSYNTDGIMDISLIENIMKKYGISSTFDIEFIDYRRFKSKSNVTNTSDLKEMLIYIEKEK